MPDRGLDRAFGPSTATFVVIASMVGAGILISPGYMMASLQNYPVIFGLWALGGLLALCGALCVAELAAALPYAGGDYVYLREAFGPCPAFLSGWTAFLLGFSAPLAVAGYMAAQYMLSAFGVPEGGVQLTAAVIILAVTLPNVLGHRQSAWTQDLTTILKLVMFVALVVAGFGFGKGDLDHIRTGREVNTIPLSTAATQLYYVLFAYCGWNAASYLAGEVRDPSKTLPRALLLGTGVVTALYLAVTLVFAYAIPPGDVAFVDAEKVPQIAVERLFGLRAVGAFSVAVGVTFLATVSAYVVTGPRIYYAMACDGLFPSFAARLSANGRVPVLAMLAQSGCAIVLLFATDFQQLYQYASVGLSLFSMLAIAAVFVLRRRRPNMIRPFRVPGYPAVPAVFLVVTLFMAGFAFVEWPAPSIYSLASILAGVPVYYVWSQFSRRRERS
jgi:APA family basic amino acid/polyamine antiporter